MQTIGKRFLFSAVIFLALGPAANGVFAQSKIPGVPDIGDIGIPTPKPTIPAPYDAKTFSGSFCQPDLDNSDAHGNSFTGYPHGAVNRAPHARWVACPVMRDNTQNEDGTWRSLYGAGVEVVVRNQAPVGSGEDLFCRFNSYTRLANLRAYDEGILPPSPGPIEEQIGVIELDVDDSDVQGFYTLRCLLPANSAVLSYTVKEFLLTDDDS